jgi:hypothetical protein
MTGLLPCTCSDTCQADTACHRPPCFQARLDAACGASRAPIRRRAEACASHLGTMVTALAAWARDHDLTDGDLTILAIEPARPGQAGLQPQTSGLAFSTIHLSA